MAHVREKTDSVYDFLYIDSPRLRLFNSQFDQYGHITELTRSATTSSSSGGGFDVKVVKADTSEGEQTGISKKYDTQFIAPLTFLDHAQDMIVRDIARAGIGQFVLCTGALRILDLMMLREAWELSSVQRIIHSGVKEARSVGQNRHARRAERHSGADSASTLSLMIDMLRLMPHGLQGQLRAPPYQIWSAMRAEGFVTQPSDVILNHGVELTGIWNVVGILDAVPSPMVTLIEDDGSAPEGNVHSLVGNTAIAIQPLARQFLGRPEGAFGVTPLLIFREVTR